MSALEPFFLAGPDGRRIRGDRAMGKERQILFITGFLSKRWDNKSKALAQWCLEKGWGFCCYDARGFGESEGEFTEYTLTDWIADARLVLDTLKSGPPITIVGNSLDGWIAWLMAQEFSHVEELILVAPAFNMMGMWAKQMSDDRRHTWHTAGWMPWDDEPVHRNYLIAWKWVEESEAHWKTSFDRVRRVKTTTLRGLQDSVIPPRDSSQFTEQLLARDATFQITLNFVPGDHRLSNPEHLNMIQRLVQRKTS